jgi:hypothetical protein
LVQCGCIICSAKIDECRLRHESNRKLLRWLVSRIISQIAERNACELKLYYIRHSSLSPRFYSERRPAKFKRYTKGRCNQYSAPNYHV